jgi:hypothetical protein
LSAPSRSTTVFQVTCTPPSASFSNFCSVKRARTREPLGSGAVKRTRFRP